MPDTTLWVGYAGTIGISNSSTGNPSPTYTVHETGQGARTVTFTPRNPVTEVTAVDVKTSETGYSLSWVTAAVGTNGRSITDPGTETTAATYYYAVAVMRPGHQGADTLDPLWQHD